jgi:hypothetical protein
MKLLRSFVFEKSSTACRRVTEWQKLSTLKCKDIHLCQPAKVVFSNCYNSKVRKMKIIAWCAVVFTPELPAFPLLVEFSQFPSFLPPSLEMLWKAVLRNLCTVISAAYTPCWSRAIHASRSSAKFSKKNGWLKQLFGWYAGLAEFMRKLLNSASHKNVSEDKSESILESETNYSISSGLAMVRVI